LGGVDGTIIIYLIVKVLVFIVPHLLAEALKRKKGRVGVNLREGEGV
jgi:hypothetical protein